MERIQIRWMFVIQGDTLAVQTPDIARVKYLMRIPATTLLIRLPQLTMRLGAMTFKALIATQWTKGRTVLFLEQLINVVFGHATVLTFGTRKGRGSRAGIDNDRLALWWSATPQIGVVRAVALKERGNLFGGKCDSQVAEVNSGRIGYVLLLLLLFQEVLHQEAWIPRAETFVYSMFVKQSWAVARILLHSTRSLNMMRDQSK
jgi:hypothetical protein